MMSRNKRKAAEDTAAATGPDSRRTRSKRGKAEEGEEAGPDDKTTATITTGDDSKEETPKAPVAEDPASAESESEAKEGDKGEKGLDEASEVKEEEVPAKTETKEEAKGATPAAAAAAVAKAVAKEVEKEVVTKEVAKEAAKDAAKEVVKEVVKEAAKEVPKEVNVATPKPSTPAETAHWNNMFFQLMLYRVEHGNVNVKSTDDKHKDLYKWIVQLRKDYKIRERSADASPLTADQIDVLESVRFAFTTRGEEHWQKSYEKLKEYQEEHGHVLVPRQCEIPGLGDWVTSQRQQYQDYKEGKPTPLTKQRKDLLDEIGFQWRVRNRPEWTSKFEELLIYKAKHGDTRVPQHYAPNKALGKWVAKQREQFKLLKKGKHSFLTPDRLEKLNGIEFAWAVRGDTAEDAGNSDEAAASLPGDGEGGTEVEPKEEEGESKKDDDGGESKKEGETKPKPEVKKEDDGEASAEKKVETVTV